MMWLVNVGLSRDAEISAGVVKAGLVGFLEITSTIGFVKISGTIGWFMDVTAGSGWMEVMVGRLVEIMGGSGFTEIVVC